MKKEINATIKSNQGFYIGDPCYALADNVYDGVWGEHGYEDGKITVGEHAFVVAGTAYGDGCYYDQHYNSYGVDSGTIALIPLELVVKRTCEELSELGRIIKESGEAEFTAQNGIFEIETNEYNVKIDTNFEDEEDMD